MGTAIKHPLPDQMTA